MLMMRFIKYSSFFCLVTILFLTIGVKSAQIDKRTRARLEGIIINIEQEAIFDATIQLKHEETGQTFQEKSNEKGRFSFAFLTPGNYIVNVQKKGYETYTGELEFRPNTSKEIKFTLVREERSEEKLEKEAISAFEQGVKLAGENNDNEAIQAFQRAVELKKDFAEAYMNLGILLFRQQKDDEAEKAFLKALELKPEESLAQKHLAEINYEKARSLIQKNKIDEALEKLKLAYSYKADHVYVNYLLGYVYYKKEMKDEAIKHLNAFLQLEPDTARAEKVKKLLENIKKSP
jgi:tetratricopeptide (TPR) repeat protein